MARALSPERQKEYETLSAYIALYATAVMGIDPASPIHPSNVAASIIERFGKSKALEGTRQAANDTVEHLRDHPAAIKLFDQSLQAAGLITFSEVFRRYGSSYRRILRRGKIKTETEFHLMSGVLSDQSIALGDAEREELVRLTDQFESAAARDSR